MQTKLFKNKKARWVAAILGLELLILLALKACEHSPNLEFLQFDPGGYFGIGGAGGGSKRAAALWAFLALLGLVALFFLFRMFASGGGSILRKTVLASVAAVALLLATLVPDDVKLPQISMTPKTTQAPIEELNCLDMGCFEGGGPSLPAAPAVPAAPAPNAGNTGT